MTDTVSLIRRTAKALRDWRPDPAEEIAVVVEHLLMVRSALQVVERQYGTLELHGRDPASVRMAAGIVLERLRLCATTAPGPRSSPSRRSPGSAPARPGSSTGSARRSLLPEDETMCVLDRRGADSCAGRARMSVRRSLSPASRPIIRPEWTTPVLPTT